ncbi:hypothetical protein [Neisseria animalis]|nr:hypothetical protein [Neisseria animalis]VEE07303.1 Uncharacterised protein [Neisseria animalis]
MQIPVSKSAANFDISKSKFNRLSFADGIGYDGGTFTIKRALFMAKTKTLMLTGILALFANGTLAADLPAEIYQPAQAQTIKAEKQNDNEFEYKAELPARSISVSALAEKVTAHAQKQGFLSAKSEIKRDEADLEFKRGRQKLDISIDLEANGKIEYQADLDWEDDN